jgi:uncharacterized protein YndB with AHSA1/START domain
MSTTKKTPVATVRLRKTVKAPIDRVFKAWTEPDLMSKWFKGEHVTGVRVFHDFKVGGNYRIEMSTADMTMLVLGIYEEIVTNKKLVFTWTSDFPEFATTDSLVSVQFIDKGDSTEIILDHSRFDTEKAAEGHTAGWTFALNTLAEIL